MSISPEIWGPSAWKFLHYITLAYPENPTASDMKKYKDFFTSLSNVLPCMGCRINYSDNLKKQPLTNTILKSKIKFVEWLIDIHNEVNSKTGKKILTLNEVLEIYLKKSYDYYEQKKNNFKLPDKKTSKTPLKKSSRKPTKIKLRKSTKK